MGGEGHLEGQMKGSESKFQNSTPSGPAVSLIGQVVIELRVRRGVIYRYPRRLMKFDPYSLQNSWRRGGALALKVTDGMNL